MEGMDSVRHLIRQGDWMVKLDLKDAYLLVPICLEHQPFLCFRWRSICYQFTCLAFRFSPAPRLFTKLLKPVVGALRRAGIRLVIYVDDIIFMNESREGVISDVSTAIDLLITSLGFLVNWEKSVLLPSQSLEYLGLLIDSVALSLALPSDKVLSMLEMCRRSLSKGPLCPGTLSPLQRLYIYHSKSFNYDLSRYVALLSSARDDIRWWLENLSSFNGLCFLKRDPDLIIYLDASLHGWGFACDGVCSRGPWAGSDRLRYINELEFLAAFYALKSLTAQSTNLEINLILDNSTAVSYVNKHGGTRSRALCDISSSIVSWCERAVQDIARRKRLDALPVVLPEVASGMENGCRFVFGQMECPITDLRVMDDATGCVCSERFFVQLEQIQGLRLSPIRPHSQVPGESEEGESGTGTCMPTMVQLTLVPSPVESGLRHSPNLSLPAGSSRLKLGCSSSANNKQFIDTIRLEIIMGRLIGEGLSEDVVHLLLKSNRESTSAAYQSAWSIWLISMVRASLIQQSISIAPCFLARLILLKGYQSHVGPYYCLGFYVHSGTNSDLNLATLSKKLVTSIALVTLFRVSEIASISKDSAVFSNDGVSFSLSCLRKTQRSGGFQSFNLRRINDPLICPVECLGIMSSVLISWEMLIINQNCSLVFVSLTKRFPVRRLAVGSRIIFL
uniref:Reverse transcriptase domain-containing protein n=1 Tax=Daphnia galeata TaxID=27404 RepID=A0A8J2S1D2_9CRUS|nr:unnamed protein product [Daphnia galeata]